jgi:hypothetical protein
MSIILVVSGIIVFDVIITVKYFNEEDTDKIGPALKRVVMWQLSKDNNVGELKEVPIRSGFEETGIDDDTSVRNMA